MKKYIPLILILLFAFCAKGTNETNNNNDSSESDYSGTIHVSENIDSRILEENTEIDGYLFKAGTPVAFTPSGQIRFGVLAESSLIDGILYAEDTFIEFDKNNNVISSQ